MTNENNDDILGREKEASLITKKFCVVLIAVLVAIVVVVVVMSVLLVVYDKRHMRSMQTIHRDSLTQAKFAHK